MWPWVVVSVAIHGILLAFWLQPDIDKPSSNMAQDQSVEVFVDFLSPVVIEYSQAVRSDTAQEKSTASELVEVSKKVSPLVMQTSHKRPLITKEINAVPKKTEALVVKKESVFEAPIVTTSPKPQLTQAQLVETMKSKPAIDAEQVRQLVRNHLEQFKYYPSSARRRGIEGHVEVAFHLGKQGAADQVSVLRGSGYAVLDHAALETVHRAEPFPVKEGQYRFRLRFSRL